MFAQTPCLHMRGEGDRAKARWRESFKNAFRSAKSYHNSALCILHSALKMRYI